MKRIHRELSKSPPETVSVQLRSENTQHNSTTPSTPKRQKQQQDANGVLIYSPDYEPTYTDLVAKTSTDTSDSTNSHSNDDNSNNNPQQQKQQQRTYIRASRTKTIPPISALLTDDSMKTAEQEALENQQFNEAMAIYLRDTTTPPPTPTPPMPTGRACHMMV